MRTRQVDVCSRRDVMRFIRLPFRLYKDSPYWVPPLISDMRAVLDPRRHVFYQHSQAAFFICQDDDDQVVGRLSVFDNRRYNDYHRSAVAHFYYFEAIDALGVARSLFDAGMGWARRRGLNRIVGPKGMLRGDAHGLLVEGFDYCPSMGVPYNPPYYDALMRGMGFDKEIDFVSGYIDGGSYQLPGRVHDLAERVRQRRGFEILEFTERDDLMRWVPAIKRVNNEAFTDVWGYYPVDDQEIDAVAKRLLSIADPRLIKLVVKGDELAGFLFTFPNIAEGLRRANGHLFPLGWYHILRDRKRTPWADLNGAGLLPQFQGVGANVILYTELEKTFRAFGFEHAELVQISEHNQKSLGEARFGQSKIIKRHRIYTKEIG